MPKWLLEKIKRRSITTLLRLWLTKVSPSLLKLTQTSMLDLSIPWNALAPTKVLALESTFGTHRRKSTLLNFSSLIVSRQKKRRRTQPKKTRMRKLRGTKY